MAPDKKIKATTSKARTKTRTKFSPKKPVSPISRGKITAGGGKRKLTLKQAILNTPVPKKVRTEILPSPYSGILPDPDESPTSMDWALSQQRNQKLNESPDPMDYQDSLPRPNAKSSSNLTLKTRQIAKGNLKRSHSPTFASAEPASKRYQPVKIKDLPKFTGEKNEDFDQWTNRFTSSTALEYPNADE